MEGGSFDVDGRGTLLTTEECLLNPNRNPDLSRAEIERTSPTSSAVDTIVWLRAASTSTRPTATSTTSRGSSRPGVVALTWTDDTDDPQYERSAEALDILGHTKDAQGNAAGGRQAPPARADPHHAEEAAGVDAVDGTQPRNAGDRLAGSYVNSYLGNGIAVVPVFDDPHDEEALDTYRRLLPGRRVIPVPGAGDPARRRQRPLRHPAGPQRLRAGAGHTDQARLSPGAVAEAADGSAPIPCVAAQLASSASLSADSEPSSAV